MKDLEKEKILIIASPSIRDNPGLYRLIDILFNISHNLYIITGNLDTGKFKFKYIY